MIDWPALAQKKFGFSKLKRAQLECLNYLGAGQDLIAVLPTGIGKSLIYQLAGLSAPHLSVVISPLVALMFDQVRQLHQRHVSAASWNSLTPPDMEKQVIAQLLEGRLKFLYLSPEKLQSKKVTSILDKVSISYLNVDEAHCISEWSPDFRPEYGEIGTWLNNYQLKQSRPIVTAFTATATKATVKDIVNLLKQNQPQIVALPCFRPNLRYHILPVPSEGWKRIIMKKMINLATNNMGGRVLIYTSTRLMTGWLAQWLITQGLTKVKYFHAGLLPTEKENTLSWFASVKAPVLITTNAFGMGIDIPDIRLVLHHSPPASIEAYAQEAGRAGRDGLESLAITLYRSVDLENNLKFLLSSASFEHRKRLLFQARQMYRLLEHKQCINRTIVKYFRLPQTQRCSLASCHCGRCYPKFFSNDIAQQIKQLTRQN